jgi:L-seryl-tRNA(Ser) seleniumtransferase
VEEPALGDLVRVGGERGIPVVHDLGSGALFEIDGIPREPRLAESLAAGTDLVTLSGDKLVGGPQAGIVLGKASWIARIRRNPLARALRVDKFTIAALAATLDLLEDAQRARASIPTLRALRWTQGDLAPRATRIAGALSACAALRVRVTSSWSEVGGGAAPEEGLATTVVALTHESFDAEQLAAELRRARVPVVGRIVQNEVLLDPRTLDPEEDDELVRVVLDRLGSEG